MNERMQVKKEKNNVYTLKSYTGTYRISTYIKKDFLVINIDNFELRYTYSDFIDIDKRFRGFSSIDDIHKFILLFIKDGYVKMRTKQKQLILFTFTEFYTIPFKSNPSPQLIINSSEIIFQVTLPYPERERKNSSNAQLFSNIELTKSIEFGESFGYGEICFLEDGRWKMEDGRWKMEDGRWKMEDGRWKMEDGRWKMEDGRWKMENRRLVSSFFEYDGEKGYSDIVVYNINTYSKDLVIRNAHGKDNFIKAICGLRNGNLASGAGNFIIIWEITRESDYKKLYTLEGHTDAVNKIIELEDGKLCSCSSDTSIKIWDNKNKYQCIKTLKEHSFKVKCIIEINSFIVSCSGEKSYEQGLIIWNKPTFEVVRKLNFTCSSRNCLANYKDTNLIVASNEKLIMIDIKTFKTKFFMNEVEFGKFYCIYVLKNDRVLLGNKKDKIIEIICFDLSTKQIIFTKKEKQKILSLIVSEDNRLITLSQKEIKIYTSKN